MSHNTWRHGICSFGELKFSALAALLFFYVNEWLWTGGLAAVRIGGVLNMLEWRMHVRKAIYLTPRIGASILTKNNGVILLSDWPTTTTPKGAKKASSDRQIGFGSLIMTKCHDSLHVGRSIGWWNTLFSTHALIHLNWFIRISPAFEEKALMQPECASWDVCNNLTPHADMQLMIMGSTVRVTWSNWWGLACMYSHIQM